MAEVISTTTSSNVTVASVDKWPLKKGVQRLYIVQCLTNCQLGLDGQLTALHKNDLVVIRSIQNLTLQTFASHEMVRIRLFREKITLSSLTSTLIAGDNPLMTDLLNAPETDSAYVTFRNLKTNICQGYCEQLAQLERLRERDRYVRYQIQLQVLSLLTELLRGHLQTGSAMDSHFSNIKNIKHVSKKTQGGVILTYMTANVATVTLKSAATHFGYQSNYFSRLFQQIFRQSFSERLTQIKIDMSKNLLVLTNQDVARISEQLGYQNPASFNKNFKTFTNMTPTQYRKAFERTEHIQ